mgnify:CR=1 FL=1
MNYNKLVEMVMEAQGYNRESAIYFIAAYLCQSATERQIKDLTTPIYKH